MESGNTYKPTGSVKNIPLTSPGVHAGMFAAFTIIAASFHSLDKSGVTLGHLSENATVCDFLFGAAVSAAAYELVSLLLHGLVRVRRGSPGEVKMLTSFFRVVVIVTVAILLLSATGKLQQLGAVMGMFAGMLLGWSLQAPVSGMAAWILITLKRPFRVGDRIQFPSLSLSGDVLDVGLMYTKLDQVGGAVGSEEAIGRYILIPNAMLFGQVAINYTPQAQSAYFLDEVVVRLTYDSDLKVAEQILLSAARDVTAEIIKITGKQPYIRSDLYDYGVYVRLRFMTMAMDRPRVSHEIVSRVFEEFQHNPRVDFAIPFVYSYHKGMEAGHHSAANGAADGTPQSSVQEVPIDKVDDPQEGDALSANDENGVKELAERFTLTHMVQPLAVRPTASGRYTLVSGRFRYLAARRLGWKIIPVVVRPGGAAPDSVESGKAP